MNKLKRYICRGCAFLGISSVIAAGGYAYTIENRADYRNESLEDALMSSFESESSNKYEKRGTIVNVESLLNVRQQPSMDSLIENTLNNGEVIHIIDEKEGWYEIQNDSSTGYVKNDFVEEHKDRQALIVVPLNNKVKKDEEVKSDVITENLSSAADSSDSKPENNSEGISVQETVSAERTAEEAPKGKLINVELTAYCNDEQCSGKWGGTTAMGTETRTGVVAAPEGITLGSRLYIPELSYYKSDALFNVEDRGGAVKMKDDGTYIIDVWFPTYEQVVNFGRVRTTAYILEQ
ncbi:SH3 domain-containing protein [uncultured Clostridium sp.]|uniref:SH3 domain-containing protein n=1 Tax=uncultured Clostridium sp. TaxID=59620 RepID=UPI0025F1AEAB|nr:SH3 domain-containing protein [uncultured Clostridium sp.]